MHVKGSKSTRETRQALIYRTLRPFVYDLRRWAQRRGLRLWLHDLERVHWFIQSAWEGCASYPHVGAGIHSSFPHYVSPLAPRMRKVLNNATTLGKHEIRELASEVRYFKTAESTEFASAENFDVPGYGFVRRSQPSFDIHLAGLLGHEAFSACGAALRPVWEACEAARVFTWIECGICREICPPSRKSKTCPKSQDPKRGLSRRQRQWRLHHPDAGYVPTVRREGITGGS